MNSLVRRAAVSALRDVRVGVFGRHERFSSSAAAATPVVEAVEQQEPKGDPGPSTVQHAKAHRRKLHAQLMSFSESAKESSVDLETFNDILSGPTGSKARSVSDKIVKTANGAPARPRPTLADSPFIIHRKESLEIDDEDLDKNVFPEDSFESSHRSRRVREDRITRNPNFIRGARNPLRQGGKDKESDETFRRIKDGPYALSGRIKIWIQNHPSPLSTPLVEELIGMVADAPKGDVNEVVWGQVFGILGRERKLDRMWRAYNDMKKKGHKPSLRTYTTLLNAYASVPHSGSPATSAFEPVPEERTLSRVSIIFQQSQEHIARLQPAGDPAADSGLAYPEARARVDEDEEIGVQATNAYLKFLARYGMYAEAEGVFKDMLKGEGGAGGRPDAVTFTTLFMALLNAHQRQQNATKYTSPPRRTASKPIESNAASADPPVRRLPRDGQLREPVPKPSERLSPMRIKRQFPRAEKFQHRPKPSGFGLRKDSTQEARAYTTQAQPVSQSTGVTFDSLMEHVKEHRLAETPTAEPTGVHENTPSHSHSHTPTPDQNQPRRFVPRQRGYGTPRPSFAHPRALRDTAHSRTGAYRESRLDRGSITPDSRPPTEEIPAAVPSPIEIGKKAHWIWSEALSLLAPPSGSSNAISSLDDAVAIPAIQCLLQGKSEDQRYALALIPRLFNLPSLPSSSPTLPPDFPESLPTLSLSPIGATVLVSSLTRANRPSLATHYATIFLAPVRWSSPLDMAFFSSMINALSNTGDIHPILQVLETRRAAKSGGVHWPIRIYCEALTAARWARDWEAAKRVWRMMEEDHALGVGSSEDNREVMQDASAKRRPPRAKVDSKAMSLLLKIALAKGKKDVQEAVEIYDKFGDAYGFGARSRAGRKDELIVLKRRVRDREGSLAGASPDEDSRGNAWVQELRMEVQRAREILSPRAKADPLSS